SASSTGARDPESVLSENYTQEEAYRTAANHRRACSRATTSINKRHEDKEVEDLLELEDSDGSQTGTQSDDNTITATLDTPANTPETSFTLLPPAIIQSPIQPAPTAKPTFTSSLAAPTHAATANPINVITSMPT
ncbi:hypothetical protein FRB94_006523, partial [Tulasnella sp. JGI-2019a]